MRGAADGAAGAGDAGGGRRPGAAAGRGDARAGTPGRGDADVRARLSTESGREVVPRCWSGDEADAVPAFRFEARVYRRRF